MSVLWPERVEVGIAAQSAWIARRGVATAYALPEKIERGQPLPLGKIFSAALDQAMGPARRRLSARVCLAAPVGRVIALPWQTALSRHAEWHAYACHSFDAAGLEVGEDWAVHAEFRSHGRCGIAYAVPLSSLAMLEDAARERNVRLDEVLPMAASIYFLHRHRGAGISCVILDSPGGVSALVVDRCGPLAIEFEPAPQVTEHAVRRLVLRLSTQFSTPTGVTCWSGSAPAARDAVHAHIRQVWPAAQVTMRRYEEWPN